MALVLAFLSLLLPLQTGQSTDPPGYIHGRRILVSTSQRGVERQQASSTRLESLESIRSPSTARTVPTGLPMDPFWPTSVAQKRTYQAPSRRLVANNTGFVRPPPGYRPVQSDMRTVNIARAEAARRIAQADAARPSMAQVEAARASAATAEPARASPATAEPMRTNDGRAEAMQAIADQANAVRALRASRAEEAQRRLAASTTADEVGRRVVERRIEPIYPGAATRSFEISSVDDVGGLPSVYQTPAEPRRMLPDDGDVPLRIIHGGDFLVYYSAGMPVYLRYKNPASPMACALEYDAGINGHRSEVSLGSSWLYGPEFGRIGLSQRTENNLRLDLTQVTIPGCVLGSPSWTQIDRVWTLDKGSRGN
ncbi:MAG: hypothetical protein ACI84D_003108 [Thalassolituus oleivorans]|jgi:hypothetical protein